MSAGRFDLIDGGNTIAWGVKQSAAIGWMTKRIRARIASGDAVAAAYSAIVAAPCSGLGTRTLDELGGMSVHQFDAADSATE